ncbi:propanediol utilization protein [Pseudotabrizicola sediminis]|uniref:Propanediol utilization protein n=1 Tax=Pseudotabrizicola sediminis TaxID=2486418 RepID=A0ABY2KJI0_9RHOB|nr:propanediol utilization protein [Pseudotabrizicola sediminis]TGD42571.1 propanediol utilization protein [Pseudotabrizicola sediminis]
MTAARQDSCANGAPARALHLSGHFGEWMQGRLGPGGPVVLITLPCAVLGVTASMDAGAQNLRGAGLDGPHGAAAAARFIAYLGLDLPYGVRVQACAEAGLGTGVSTASLLALARLARWRGPASMLARACLRAEGASDPLMSRNPERLLWASRQGRALARLPALPAYEVIGGFFGLPRITDPADSAFPDIVDLVPLWKAARDLEGFAALASVSARRSLDLRGPAQDPTADLASRLGALGWIIAHTGAARGLIFAPGRVPDHAAQALRDAGMRGILQFSGGRA